MDKIDEVLTRGVEKIYPTKETLEKVLRSGRKIRLYQGFDPSMPSLHLGNTVGLLKMKQFQELGHKVIFLIGGFTGMIGDPSGKSETRRPLTREQVLANAKNYPQQVSKILKFDGPNPAEIKFNSSWLDKLNYTEVAKLASLITYAQVIERDMFQKRMKDGKDLFLSELLYPLMQGYDSVAMDVDMEIGGSDQIFNMLMGRTLMKKIKGKEKFVMGMKLLVDAQGNKVGKTAGNALFLNASAADLFGGVMSFPDETLIPAFELLTEEPLQWIKEQEKALQSNGLNPMDLKKRLAFEIVKMYHGELNAKNAEKEFERVFQKGEASGEAVTVKVKAGDWNVIDLLTQTKLISSRAEAKRLITQGAVDIDGKRFKSLGVKVQDNMIIKIGKRKFAKIALQ